MATVEISLPEPRTVGQLLADMGGVPAERVRLVPTPGSATEADAVMAAGDRRRPVCELIDGVLVEKGVGFNESALAIRLALALGAFALERNLGVVTGEQGLIRLFPGSMWAPDLAFVAWDRLPGRRRPTASVPTLAPDLVVEILSASNTPAEMLRKRRDYFAAGVRLV